MVNYTGGNPHDQWSDPNSYRYYEEQKTKNWTPGFGEKNNSFSGISIGGGSSSSGSSGSAAGGGGALLFLLFIGYCVFFGGDDKKPAKHPASDVKTSQQTAPSAPAKGYAIVNTENLNLHQCAAKTCPNIAIMPRNVKAQILSQFDNGWLELLVDGGNQKFHGYANGAFMKIYNNP